MTAIDLSRAMARRRFLAGAVAGLCSPLASTAASTSPCVEQATFVAAARSGPSAYAAVLLDASLQSLAVIDLPQRAHAAASSASAARLAIFARRPGTYICCIDQRRPGERRFIEPNAGRHFYGHGVFSDDGRYLFATENDYEAGRGVVGVYDFDNVCRRIAELDTGGTGPHDIAAVPSAGVLIVANGGIRTHPDHGREKLNLDSMQPSLTAIDWRSGAIVARVTLPDALRQLSIRHLSMDHSGRIWFAGQFQGRGDVPTSLAGAVSLRDAIDAYSGGRSRVAFDLLQLPVELARQSQGYLSSIASDSRSLMVTSSKGGFACQFDLRSGRLIEAISMFDCSGVAPLPTMCRHSHSSHAPSSSTGFLLSSGSGELRIASPEPAQRFARYQWDNHLQLI